MFDIIKKHLKTMTKVNEEHSENLLKEAQNIYDNTLKKYQQITNTMTTVELKRKNFEAEKELWKNKKENFMKIKNMELKEAKAKIREEIKQEYMTDSAMDLEVKNTKAENTKLVQRIVHLREIIEKLEGENNRIIDHNNILMDKIVAVSELAIKESNVKSIEVDNHNSN